MAVNILLKRSATANKRPVGASMAFGELNLNYDASTGGLYYKDSSGNVVKVGPCQVSATAPNSSPSGSAGNSAGEFWYDSSTSTLKVYDGSAWVESGGAVDSVTGTAPITVDNTDPLNPIIGVDAASTTAPGVVQLNNTTSSTSVTEALTANQGYVLQQQIDALVTTSNLTLAGTYNAATGLVDNVTAAGTAAGFTNGSALPAPASGNAEYFVIVDVEGSTGPSGTPPYHVGDWFLSDGTTWLFLNVGLQPAYATTSSAGVVQLATDAEVQAGVNTDHAVVPSSLQSKLSDSVSTTSSTTIASSTAVKTANDAASVAQSDADAAQLTANQAVLDAAAAQGTADQAVLDAAAAQSDANQALLDAAAAQSSANAAQSDATQALSDAAAAQATADAAMPKAGGDFTGNVDFLTGTTTTFNSGSVLNVEGSTTFGVGSTTTIDGSFTFNTAPTFPAGVDIGAALQVTFDNAGSGLAATNVQDAIDEIVDEFIPNASFTSAGDLLVGSGAGTYAALPAGAADYILASDGAGGLTWVPQSEGDVTGVTGTAPITVDNTDPQNPVIGISGASTFGPGAVQLNDAVNSTSVIEAATANAAKTAYDAGVQGQTDAAAAQATADAALPKAGGTMTGNIVFQDAGEGVQFNGGSAVYAISDSVSTTSSTTAASSTAVKAAYDAAIAAQTSGPLTSDTVLYVNATDGNNTTAARGTDRPYATIAAAIAAASDGDTIFLSAGTFTENFTINKGIHLAGTFSDQATWSGTKILGNVTVSLAGGVTRNLAVSDIYFISANSTSPVSVTGMSPGAGGINTFTNCMFTQQTVTDTAQFAFQTSGTWTRSLYLRACTIDGNFKHNAGTAAGASGYIVIDALLGVGNSNMYHYILTGTVEYRNPSNSLASIFQTGGVALVNNASAGITANAATTSAVFGGTGFSYKGSAAALGGGTIYFQGGSNQGTGKVDIGANLIYGWTNLTIDPANLTVNGSAVAYTTAVPSAANAQAITQQRPRFDLLKATSSVSAANQLGTVIDSSTGTVYSVAAYDAGTY